MLFLVFNDGERTRAVEMKRQNAVKIAVQLPD